VVDLHAVGFCLRAPNEAAQRELSPPLHNAFCQLAVVDSTREARRPDPSYNGRSIDSPR